MNTAVEATQLLVLAAVSAFALFGAVVFLGFTVNMLLMIVSMISEELRDRRARRGPRF